MIIHDGGRGEGGRKNKQSPLSLRSRSMLISWEVWFSKTSGGEKRKEKEKNRVIGCYVVSPILISKQFYLRQGEGELSLQIYINTYYRRSE